MKSKSVFVCKQCGNETPRWQGQCPACGAWNSIVEFEDKKVPAAKAAGRAGIARAVPKKLKEVTGEQEIRFSTGMQELDRVLGGGVNLGMSDAYVNVIGGLQLDEPAADLALVLAAASSFRDKPIDPATAAIGEVGLTGEIRAVTGLQQRLSEASRTGFKTCIIPRHGTGNITAPDGMELLRVRNIREAIQLVLS